MNKKQTDKNKNQQINKIRDDLNFGWPQPSI